MAAGHRGREINKQSGCEFRSERRSCAPGERSPRGRARSHRRPRGQERRDPGRGENRGENRGDKRGELPPGAVPPCWQRAEGRWPPLFIAPRRCCTHNRSRGGPGEERRHGAAPGGGTPLLAPGPRSASGPARARWGRAGLGGAGPGGRTLGAPRSCCTLRARCRARPGAAYQPPAASCSPRRLRVSQSFPLPAGPRGARGGRRAGQGAARHRSPAGRARRGQARWGGCLPAKLGWGAVGRGTGLVCPRERRAKWLGSVGQSMRAESEVQVQAPASLGKADGRAGGEAGNLGPTVGLSPRSEPSPGALGAAEQQGSVAWATALAHREEARGRATHLKDPQAAAWTPTEDRAATPPSPRANPSCAVLPAERVAPCPGCALLSSPQLLGPAVHRAGSTPWAPRGEPHSSPHPYLPSTPRRGAEQPLRPLPGAPGSQLGAETTAGAGGTAAAVGRAPAPRHRPGSCQLFGRQEKPCEGSRGEAE